MFYLHAASNLAQNRIAHLRWLLHVCPSCGEPGAGGAAPAIAAAVFDRGPSGDLLRREGLGWVLRKDVVLNAP